MNQQDNVDRRLDDAIRAIRQLPIPDPPAIEIPPAKWNVPQVYRQPARYRVLGIGSVVAASLLAIVVGSWMYWKSPNQPEPIVNDKLTQELAKPNGLISRSEIFIQVKSQRKPIHSSVEIAQLRASLAALQSEYQRPRPYIGYDRLQRLLVSFRSAERKEP